MLRSSSYTLAILSLVLSSMAYSDVAALGRLEPQHGIVRVSAPVILESGNGILLKSLHVVTGDRVDEGQLLGVTESAGVLEAQFAKAVAAVELSKQEVRAAQALADADCVRAAVSRREADRRKSLLDQNLSSQEESERASADAEFQEATCQASRVKAEASEAAVTLAERERSVRQTLVERSQIKSPVTGTVLQINTWPGEAIGPPGILEIGKTDHMYAIAEVYETDIAEVKPGQLAMVSSKALASVLNGTVERIRPVVRKQDVMGTDPAARKDARVIEVEIRLESSASISQLTNLQVEILIET